MYSDRAIALGKVKRTIEVSANLDPTTIDEIIGCSTAQDLFNWVFYFYMFHLNYLFAVELNFFWPFKKRKEKKIDCIKEMAHKFDRPVTCHVDLYC